MSHLIVHWTGNGVRDRISLHTVGILLFIETKGCLQLSSVSLYTILITTLPCALNYNEFKKFSFSKLFWLEFWSQLVFSNILAFFELALTEQSFNLVMYKTLKHVIFPFMQIQDVCVLAWYFLNCPGENNL